MKANKPPAKLPPPRVPHPVDDLVKVESVLDAKLKTMDGRKLRKLRRIARLERDLTGGEDW